MQSGSTRRTFLGYGVGGTLALPAVGTVAFETARTPPDEPVLVVVQIRGGWDGLNMLIPADDDAYGEARPRLAIRKADGLPVERHPELRWHPGMAAWRDLFDRGEVAVVRNVSHAYPDLSHFDSEAKWHTADPVGGVRHEGWLTRLLRAFERGEADEFAAITVEPWPTQSLAGRASPAFTSVQQMALLRAPTEVRVGTDAPPLVRRVAEAMQRAMTTSQRLVAVGADYRAVGKYPDDAFAAQLSTVARLLVGGLRTRVFHLQTGGFDTHSQQCEPGRPCVGFFADYLRGVCDAVRAFHDDMRHYGLHRRVVVLVHSEFGRTLHENAVLGTEHGHGAPVFLIGAGVVGGMHGSAPDLAAMRANGDAAGIPFDERAVDFRSIYTTIAERWFGVPGEVVVHGHFPTTGAL